MESLSCLERINNIVSEVFALKQYKNIKKLWAILLAIFLSPFLVSFVASYCLILLFNIFIKLIESPISFLKGLLNNEGKNLSPFAQGIVYLISWPLIFNLYVILSVLTITNRILYICFVIDGYIWSLGGFKFHLFAEEDYKLEKIKDYCPALPVIQVSINLAFLLGTLIYCLVLYLTLYYIYLESLFLNYALVTLIPLSFVWNVFNIIYTVVAYNNKGE